MRVSFYAPWMKQNQFTLRRAYEYIHTVNSVNGLSFINISRWYVAEMENKNKHKPWDTNWSTLLHRRVNPNSLSLWVLYLIFFIVTEMRSEQLLDEFKRVLFWKKIVKKWWHHHIYQVSGRPQIVIGITVKGNHWNIVTTTEIQILVLTLLGAKCWHY